MKNSRASVLSRDGNSSSVETTTHTVSRETIINVLSPGIDRALLRRIAKFFGARICFYHDICVIQINGFIFYVDEKEAERKLYRLGAGSGVRSRIRRPYTVVRGKARA